LNTSFLFLATIMVFNSFMPDVGPESNSATNNMSDSATAGVTNEATSNSRSARESAHDPNGPNNPEANRGNESAPFEVALIDFYNTSPAAWQMVNDNVMGGVSRSRLDMHTEGFAVFSGTVSLQNNGGFASMRTQARNPADLSNFEGVSVRVLGDGKVYNLRLKTVINGRITWYAFEASFTTVAGEWQTHKLAFNEFRAVYRGSAVRGNPPLNPDAVIELGFMIKDEQEGPFSLGISSVSVYR
jgi:NADH dehydrogenase [ubiquinone] 1 alpha subcomplex assembly factor 1